MNKSNKNRSINRNSNSDEGNEGLSYEMFLNLLANSSKSSTSSLTVSQDDSDEIFFKRKEKTEQEVFDELCFDFPLLTHHELQLLALHLSTFAPENLSFFFESFPLKRSFLDGLSYIIDSNQSSPQQKGAAQLVLLNFLLVHLPYILTSDKSSSILHHFTLENENTSSAMNDFVGNEESQSDTDKLKELFTFVQYKRINSEEVWRDSSKIEKFVTSLTKTLSKATLPAETQETFLADCIFVLRDRMLDKTDSVFTLLPMTLQLLQTEERDSENSEFDFSPPPNQFSESGPKLAVSVLASLSSVMLKRRHQEKRVVQFLAEQIEISAPLFKKRLYLIIDQLEEKKVMHRVDLVTELLAITDVWIFYLKTQQNGADFILKSLIFQSYLQIFVKFIEINDIFFCHKFVSVCCFCSPNLANFAQRVNGFQETTKKIRGSSSSSKAQQFLLALVQNDSDEEVSQFLMKTLPLLQLEQELAEKEGFRLSKLYSQKSPTKDTNPNKSATCNDEDDQDEKKKPQQRIPIPASQQDLDTILHLSILCDFLEMIAVTPMQSVFKQRPWLRNRNHPITQTLFQIDFETKVWRKKASLMLSEAVPLDSQQKKNEKLTKLGSLLKELFETKSD